MCFLPFSLQIGAHVVPFSTWYKWSEWCHVPPNISTKDWAPATNVETNIAILVVSPFLVGPIPPTCSPPRIPWCQAQNATACVEDLKQRRCHWQLGEEWAWTFRFYFTGQIVLTIFFSKKTSMVIQRKPRFVVEKAAICSEKPRFVSKAISTMFLQCQKFFWLEKTKMQSDFFAMPKVFLAGENKNAISIMWWMPPFAFKRRYLCAGLDY